jgi:hypothetical protein
MKHDDRIVLFYYYLISERAESAVIVNMSICDSYKIICEESCLCTK